MNYHVRVESVTKPSTWRRVWRRDAEDVRCHKVVPAGVRVDAGRGEVGMQVAGCAARRWRSIGMPEAAWIDVEFGVEIEEAV